ncbi:MAG: peptidoglycan-associated lipoprotein Pal [Magnetococcales bacterium]|nr:peptidoglycan-associated lipoprotein Pal [Magnetococcales bacterium]MBF0149354.1 peptidoglycan-associated lipoprotein Pal [Magnetococcales bacterium]MBF0173000.1 peptidoglycan-associated lipoprotein Pal [Magnetococcales bacterium]MBF0349258.1 peptidoglycan-associated lipoprotein Pal [Magnetococcales bacterium]MBF0630937.1 peptidoglycan-associated lipoprotein Pal [Magnetococcales bacterium]
MKRLATMIIAVLFLGILAGCGAVPKEGPDGAGASAQEGGMNADGSSVGRPGGYGSNLDDPNGAGGMSGGMGGASGNVVHFEFNSAALTPQAEDILSNNARMLAKTSGRITVEGHCDERGTREYNLALGQQRADAAARYLISQGIDASRIKTISYGKERPIIKGHEETSWAQNRRAELVSQ